jgi:Ras family protein T1
MATPMAHTRTVRVAVIGDAQTGKTSLISTASDTFDARPPPVLPPVRLPRDFSPDNVPMLVTDTSSRPEDATALDMAVQQADAVVICFDARTQSTLDSIRSVWYPRVQRIKPDVPVILACCKSDLLEERPDGREIQQIREVRLCKEGNRRRKKRASTPLNQYQGVQRPI